MKTVIQIMICRCGFITYNTCQRIRHLKNCDNVEQKDRNLPVSLLKTVGTNFVTK